MKGKAFFTLIELLIVVAILLVLVCMLLPLLQRAVDQARDLNCVNNVRLQIVGSTMYSDDNNGFLPENLGSAITLRTKSGSVEGQGRLYTLGYIDDPLILWCGNEDHPANRLIQGTLNSGYGYESFLKGDRGLSNIHFRTGRRVSNEKVYNDESEVRLARLRKPEDGLAMCLGTGWSGRMKWTDLHGGRGCSLGFADGSTVFFDYEVYYFPSDKTSSGDNQYSPYFPRRTLKRVTCIYYDRKELIKDWVEP